MNKGYSQFHRLILPTLTLMIVLLASCKPATPASVPRTDVPLMVATQTPEVVTSENPPVADDIPAPVMVATSRGPDLEATDPSTVNLASGQLQLVEFFRFT